MNRTIYVCSPDDSVASCARAVRKHSVIMLVVLDEDQRIIGVLTREVVLSAFWLCQGKSVEDIMSTEIVSCSPETSPKEAARLLARSGAHSMFIADGDKLLGWIAPYDLAMVSVLKPRTRTQSRTQSELEECLSDEDLQ